MNHREFLANICQHPADMGPRLVYSDWLEEQGDVRAEYIRLAIELAECGCKCDPTCGYACIWCEEHDERGGKLIRRCAALLAKHRREWTMAGLPEGWLFDHDANRDMVCTNGGRCGLHLQPPYPHIYFDFRYGFPEILTLRFEEWQRHYQTLIDAMPVREVQITNLERDSTEADELFVKLYQKHAVTPSQFDFTGGIWQYLLAAEFPGHDPANPIKYTLPVDQGRLPRGIDPRGVMTGNEAISVTVPTIFPTPTINIGGIP